MNAFTSLIRLLNGSLYISASAMANISLVGIFTILSIILPSSMMDISSPMRRCISSFENPSFVFRISVVIFLFRSAASSQFAILGNKSKFSFASVGKPRAIIWDIWLSLMMRRCILSSENPSLVFRISVANFLFTSAASSPGCDDDMMGEGRIFRRQFKLVFVTLVIGTLCFLFKWRNCGGRRIACDNTMAGIQTCF
ncbi:hypothetical protein QL285_044339 [Trifolium repens]|nr:hypothetical protein QL285_044339 [Trifolium repens]